MDLLVLGYSDLIKMTLEFRTVADQGDLEKERLIMTANADTDIGDYAILQTGYGESLPSTVVFNAFWFPNKKISIGDVVVLYTRTGTRSERTTEGGETIHFFFWNIDSPIWETSNRCAVLLDAPLWDVLPPPFKNP